MMTNYKRCVGCGLSTVVGSYILKQFENEISKDPGIDIDVCNRCYDAGLRIVYLNLNIKSAEHLGTQYLKWLIDLEGIRPVYFEFNPEPLENEFFQGGFRVLVWGYKKDAYFRTCNTCGGQFNEAFYHFQKNGKDGRARYCPNCKRKANKLRKRKEQHPMLYKCKACEESKPKEEMMLTPHKKEVRDLCKVCSVARMNAGKEKARRIRIERSKEATRKAEELKAKSTPLNINETPKVFPGPVVMPEGNHRADDLLPPLVVSAHPQLWECTHCGRHLPPAEQFWKSHHNRICRSCLDLQDYEQAEERNDRDLDVVARRAIKATNTDFYEPYDFDQTSQNLVRELARIIIFNLGLLQSAALSPMDEIQKELTRLEDKGLK